MFKNYFITTLRNLAKYKMNSLITISGLSLGMACFILVFSYVNFEESYDNFHLNKNNIYRVDTERFHNGHKLYRPYSSSILAPLLLQEYPSIKNTTRFIRPFFSLINVGEKVTKGKQFLFADASIFNVFSFPLQQGDHETALTEPFSIVITPQTAKKYFGETNPIGQVIEYQTKSIPGKFNFKVTGVTENIPSNSTIKFNFLASYSSVKSIYGTNSFEHWDGPHYTYVQLEDNFDANKLQSLFPNFVEKYIGNSDEKIQSLRLLPLVNTYGEKIDGARIGDGGIKPLSYLFLIIAFLVLIIACINFMNLLSARSSTRAKEIGVRKVHGANRLHLFNQFIGESIIISLISLFFAVIILQLFLPLFHSFLSNAYPTLNVFAAREFDFGIMNWSFIGYMLLTAIFVGALSGIYPALILSKYEAAFVIKGETRNGKSSVWFRKILIVSQFTIAVVFIICSLHIIKQINHMKNSGFGLESNNILTIPIYDNSVRDKFSLLKNRLLQTPNIINVTASDLIPGGIESHSLLLQSEEIKDKRVCTFYVDYDFVETMGLEITAGRNFSKEFPSDSKQAFLINKGAMKKFGWNDVRSQEIELYTKQNDKINIAYTGQLIGTFNDFTYRGFSDVSTPLIIKINRSRMNYIFVKLNGFQDTKTIETIKSVWKEMNFEQAFEYSYLDDEINELFKIFDAGVTLIRFFSILAIIISGLGLFALASFVIERQTKEIGIRKVLGASIKNIVYKLSISFVVLVVIANIIAWPVAYKILSLIFQGLKDHVELNFWFFLVTAIFSIILAVFTIGLKSFYSARINPVESLRNE